jgi:hypothetical protein
VSSSNPALFNDFLVLKILRGLRALRTLKTLWMFGGAQVIIVSIFKSMGRTIKNIGVILILAIWIFGKWSKFELAHFLKVDFLIKDFSRNFDQLTSHHDVQYNFLIKSSRSCPRRMGLLHRLFL